MSVEGNESKSAMLDTYVPYVADAEVDGDES